MKTNASLALLGAALFVTACDDPPDLRTEQGQLGLRLEGTVGELPQRPASVLDAAVGTRACVTFDGRFTDGGDVYRIRSKAPDDAWLRDCFQIGAAEGASLDGDGCIVVDARGDTAMTLEPVGCALSDDDGVDFVADRLAITGHDAADLALVYDDVAVRRIWDDLDPGPASGFGERPSRTSGTAMPVVAGGSATVFLQPVVPTDGRRVVHSGATARAVGDDPPSMFTPRSDGAAVTFAVAADQRFAVELALPTGAVVGDEIVGVDPEAASAIELVVGYTRCADCERGYGRPAYAVGIVRDADGRRLFGPVIEWTIDGDAARFAKNQPGPLDVIALEAACEDGDEGDQREGPLTARHGGLSTEVTLRYVCPEPGTEDGWDVEVVDGDADDPFACSCDAGRRGAPPAVLGGMVVLGLLRRRRR